MIFPGSIVALAALANLISVGVAGTVTQRSCSTASGTKSLATVPSSTSSTTVSSINTVTKTKKASTVTVTSTGTTTISPPADFIYMSAFLVENTLSPDLNTATTTPAAASNARRAPGGLEARATTKTKYPQSVLCKETIKVVATTTVTTQPSTVTVTTGATATYYAACGPDNQVTGVHGDEFDRFFTYYGYNETTAASAYDCCVKCITTGGNTTTCGGSAFIAADNTCFLASYYLDNRSVCQGRNVLGGFWSKNDPAVAYIASNGYCGQWSYAGPEYFGY